MPRVCQDIESGEVYGYILLPFPMTYLLDKLAISRSTVYGKKDREIRVCYQGIVANPTTRIFAKNLKNE